jgi:hypothetical protein
VKKPGIAAVFVIGAILGLAAWSPSAAEEEKLGWADTAEFSFVATGGNSETTTLGLKNALTRTWEKALFTLNAGAIRAESEVAQGGVAEGDPDNPGNNERITESEDTAGSYFVNGRYDREITERFFWNAGAGWERNKPTGIENRYTALAGVGNLWVDSERVTYRTTYAATYTDQEDVVEDPGKEDSFAGLRFTSEWRQQIGERTTYTNLLILDENLDETDDLRADWTNSVAVAINARLALKASLQILYDNLPSLEELDELVRDPATGEFVGTGNTIKAELDRVDTFFTTSLVVNF